ncbi:hypothetical protein PMAC_002299 [Pneumocystis sp. 'macacae']|nr:hypothetical protein PMAC_002299 [Pneumocystis sp. 'macacae']
MRYLSIFQELRIFLPKQNTLFLFESFIIRHRSSLKNEKTYNYDRKNLLIDIDVKKIEDQYQIFENGNPLKTALGNIFKFPLRKRSFAYMVSQELRSFGLKRSEYHFLPLTSLANKAIDIFSSKSTRENACNVLLKYLDTDTILIFAPESQSSGELLALQKKSWEPLHNWAQMYWKVNIFKTFCDLGINVHVQSQETKDKIALWMHTLDKWQFAALDRAVCASKSFIIGAKMIVMGNSLLNDYLSPEEACDLAQLETDFQISQWGEIKESHNIEREDIRRLLRSANAIIKDDK